MFVQILLVPVVIALALLTALMAYSLAVRLTIFISRAIGFPTRGLLRLQREAKTPGRVLAALGMLCTILFPLLVFVGMVWTRYGGGAEFFLTGLAVVTPTWFVARLLFVIVTGEPNAARYPLPGNPEGRRGLKLLGKRPRHPTGVLARRWFTVDPPEGESADDGMVFVRLEVIKWDERRSPRVETSVEQVPREDVFGKTAGW